MSTIELRENALELVKFIKPLDAIEESYQANAIKWIEIGEEIFPIQKTDIPPQYFVVHF